MDNSTGITINILHIFQGRDFQSNEFQVQNHHLATALERPPHKAAFHADVSRLHTPIVPNLSFCLGDLFSFQGSTLYRGDSF